MDLHLTISDGFISSKIYYKRDDFDFDNYKLSILRWRYSSCNVLRGYCISAH